MKLFGMAAALIVAMSTSAFADTITRQAPQTSTGQNFTWFAPAGPSFGAPGSLTVSGRGDYNFHTEFLDVYLDDVFIARINPNNGDPKVTTTFHGADDYSFTATYGLTPGFMNAITANGQVKFFVDLSSGVNAFRSSAFVRVTLNYRNGQGGGPVPEPSTFALLGMGALGLGWYRRRRKLA